MTREEAIDIIKAERECVYRQSTGECCREGVGCGACDLVMEDVDIFEALDVAIEALKEQRPHGEWVLDKENSFVFDMYKCSLCGTYGSKRWHFCPNCGYPMISSNSKIEKSKSEIVPDYRDGWRKRGEAE